MDPHPLIDQATAPEVPAPLWFFWFVQFFKVLGFTLHAVPMSLWYAGLLLAMLLHFGGRGHGRRFATRLMTQMPVIVALGINFGIVPLLFTQLAYYKVFYPATILMAWFWLAIVGLLIPAYYGVYIYAWGVREGEAGLTPLKRTAGWSAAVFFIVIGFLFANGFSLMGHVDRWFGLWREHSVGGAALGTALNLSDPTLWPRWLLMFGLALGTTAVWILVDVAWFGRGEGQKYQQWASRFALKLYTVGMVWFAAAGSWYAFRWSDQLQEAMTGGWLLVLAIATAVAPGLPWVLMLVWRRVPPGRGMASLIGLAQLGVLAINAVSRQVVQNLNLGRVSFDPATQLDAVQLGPLVMFLAAFVVGLGVVGWMIAQVSKGSKDAPISTSQ